MKRFSVVLVVLGLVVLISSGLSGESPAAVIAYANTFDTTSGSPYLSVGAELTNEGILTNIGGQSCVMIHASSDNPYGTSCIDATWNLLKPTDMSGQDFTVEYDVYIPAASFPNLKAMQWALYTKSYTPIYSGYFTNITADTWCHVSGPVTMDNLGYNGFSKKDTTAPWIFSMVHVQFTSTGPDQDTTFYVDNLAVSNVVKK
jgi:hypothetical protein